MRVSLSQKVCVKKTQEVGLQRVLLVLFFAAPIICRRLHQEMEGAPARPWMKTIFFLCTFLQLLCARPSHACHARNGLRALQPDGGVCTFPIGCAGAHSSHDAQ